MDLKLQNFQITIEEAAAGGFSPLDEIIVDGVKCMRHLAGRRSVWQVSCKGITILLKLFYKHPKQQRDVGREWHNACRLYEAGVHIPRPLFTGRSQKGITVVAFEFIDNGRALSEVLQDADGETRQEPLRQLLAMHAKLHSMGCYQSDNHLGNYLWGDNELYMLDAASCIFKPQGLCLRDRITNMAMLGANIPLPLQSAYEQLFSYYSEHFQDNADQGVFFAKYESELPKAIRKKLENYSRKTKRSSSKLERVRLPGKIWHACRTIDPDFKKKMLDDPDQFFDKLKLLKDGNTCTVGDFSQNGCDYVIKRYNRKSLVYRLLHIFMPVRALTSWKGGHCLGLFGISTPKPIACLICKSGFLRTEAYLVMEKVCGRELDSIKKTALLDANVGLPGKFAQVWAELDTLRATHGDMKASNFILDNDDGLVLIDLDSIRFHRFKRFHHKSKKKDLNRFLRNWADEPEVRAAFEKSIHKTLTRGSD